MIELTETDWQLLRGEPGQAPGPGAGAAHPGAQRSADGCLASAEHRGRAYRWLPVPRPGQPRFRRAPGARWRQRHGADHPERGFAGLDAPGTVSWRQGAAIAGAALDGRASGAGLRIDLHLRSLPTEKSAPAGP